VLYKANDKEKPHFFYHHMTLCKVSQFFPLNKYCQICVQIFCTLFMGQASDSRGRAAQATPQQSMFFFKAIHPLANAYSFSQNNLSLDISKHIERLYLYSKDNFWYP
jgi:hypothetical protein